MEFIIAKKVVNLIKAYGRMELKLENLNLTKAYNLNKFRKKNKYFYFKISLMIMKINLLIDMFWSNNSSYIFI